MSDTEHDDGSGTELSHGDNPWRDKETMESLYEEGMTYEEMGDQLGTSPSTISHWLKRHGITVDFPDINLDKYEEPHYKDGQLLDRLYNEEKMSTVEIAAFIGCSTATLSTWFDKLGIETRTLARAQSIAKGHDREVSYYTYERGHSMIKSGPDRIPVHRLVAIAEFGADAVAGVHVHHKNGVPWDNRPKNLELLTNSDHQKSHLKVNGLDRVRVAEFYEDGDTSSRALADAFDIAPATVLYIHDEFYGGGAA